MNWVLRLELSVHSIGIECSVLTLGRVLGLLLKKSFFSNVLKNVTSLGNMSKIESLREQVSSLSQLTFVDLY
jgi:hypothetical protein